jgi:putative oxidoreductase
MHIMQRLYRTLISAANALQDPFLLLIRVAWGYQLHKVGAKKFHDLAAVTASFTRLGIPAPGVSAVFIAVLEFVGGLMFALGFGTRLISLLIVCDMTVALCTAHRAAVEAILEDVRKLYAAAPYTYLEAALIVLIFGPGRYSVDALLAKRFAARASNPRTSSRG